MNIYFGDNKRPRHWTFNNDPEPSLSPPEDPDPIGYCDWCEEDIYNEDHIVDGDVICPACAEYWDSNEVAVDFIKLYFGSMPELAEQCRHDDWMEMFAEYMRECEPDKLKMVMKKGETPCGNTTPLN